MIDNLVGTLFIVSAPSGTGKTSLVNALVRDTNHLKLSISSTTRGIRPREIDGYHYHFIEEEKFQQKITAGDFLEYAEVFGNYYGTSQESVDKMLHEGHDVVLEIDWQGAQQVRKIMPDALSVFILPPSKEALRSRLEGRGQDSADIIDRRMSEAESESSHFVEYDYLIINDQFEVAKKELCAIFVANRLGSIRQAAKNKEILADLLSS